jgi:hypothetical protein
VWDCSQTCTLKSSANPGNPVRYTGAGDSDWISGALTDLSAAQAAKSQSTWITSCDQVTGGC